MPIMDHFGYAVRNADEKRGLMEKLLGFKFLERKVYERPGNTATLDFYECQGGVLELVQNSSPDTPINKFVAARGEGLHHVCFRVDDIRATMADWEAQGVKFNIKPPLFGSRGGLLTFADASTTGGLAIELV
ncbi:MAG: VOC family protein, partial [Nitrospinota bacterium]